MPRLIGESEVETQSARRSSVEALEDQPRRMIDELMPGRTVVRDQKRVEESARRASEAIREVINMRASVERLLQEAGVTLPDLPSTRQQQRPPSPLEKRFREDALGHERPELIVRTAEEAQRHAEDIFRSERPSPGQSMGTPEAGITRQNQQFEAEVRTWFTSQYLGDDISRRIGQTPSYLSTETDQFFTVVAPRAAAFYIIDSNHLFIRDSELEVSRPEIIAHEEHHYASFLGGGMDVRWRSGTGSASDEAIVLGDQRWFIEGMTELHAQEMARSHEHAPAGVSYPYETAVGFYLQRIVGETALRQAYITGDFTAVRLAVNARLGAETFEQVARASDGESALDFLVSRLRHAHIDYHKWETNPVLSGCLDSMASDFLRGFWRRDGGYEN